MCCVFFFKQKTAYEMRISDWSSDVCSSDLGVKNGTLGTVAMASSQRMAVRTDDGREVAFETKDYAHVDHGYAATIHKAQGMTVDRTHEIGRASCRERVCQYG